MHEQRQTPLENVDDLGLAGVATSALEFSTAEQASIETSQDPIGANLGEFLKFVAAKSATPQCITAARDLAMISLLR